MKRPVRIANCSGFFGDRLAAAQEMVEGGPIDVLTGDWLAELTMLLLARQKMKHGTGYARTFHQQMEQVLPTVLDKGIKVVSNAGGLDPVASAQTIREMAADKGLTVKVASVSGDDLLPRFAQVGGQWKNLDTGNPSPDIPSANAYLGARGIVAALQAGADVVVTGRVTDAALAIGPAAWWHDWDLDSTQDLDALARLTGCRPRDRVRRPGHGRELRVLPRGARSGTRRLPDRGGGRRRHQCHHQTLRHRRHGLPGTVTAQLLYEVGDEHYLNPDVTARFDTIEIDQVGKDRVRLSGVRGESAPETLKVAINYLGGFRNSMTLVLTGSDAAEKADVAIRTICGVSLAEAKVLTPAELGARSRLDVRELTATFSPPASDDPRHVGEAQGRLVITAKDDDPKKVGKAFTRPAVESALASHPGMFPTHRPPTAPHGVYWPLDHRDRGRAGHRRGGRRAGGAGCRGKTDPGGPHRKKPCCRPRHRNRSSLDPSPTAGRTFVGARGDKGGNANVGFWVRHPPRTQPWLLPGWKPML